MDFLLHRQTCSLLRNIKYCQRAFCGTLPCDFLILLPYKHEGWVPGNQEQRAREHSGQLCPLTWKMKICTAALLFLILAVALGPLALGSLDHEFPVLERESLRGQFHLHSGGPHPHLPTNCCFSYTTRDIRCKNMQSYYETSSACSQPAVVFTTKRRRKVCADPQNERVRECMMKLDSA